MTRQGYDREIAVFARYYLGENVTDAVKERYIQYIKSHPLNISTQDQSIIDFVLQYPGSLKYIDAGLAIIAPHAELRRRLYVMFALIESDKLYVDLFLSQKRSPFYVITIGAIGFMALVKMIIGIILVKMVVR